MPGGRFSKGAAAIEVVERLAAVASDDTSLLRRFVEGGEGEFDVVEAVLDEEDGS